MNSLPKSLIFVLFLCLCSIASGKTFYVSPIGNDSNLGTLTQPFLTWKKAFDLLTPGDTAFIRGGVYTLPTGYAAYYINANGSAENPICVFNYPGETPILDLTGHNVYSYGTTLTALNINGDYLHVKGLTIRNLRQSTGTDEVKGVPIFASHYSTVENCTVYNMGGIGFQIGQSDSLTIINCDAYDCCDSISTDRTPGERGTGFAQNNIINNTSSTYFINNRAWLCSDQGFSGLDNSYVEYNGNWSFRNGMLGAGGHGFKLGFVYEADIVLQKKVINNVAAFNRYTGFTTNDNGYLAQAMQIYNNTAYHNGYQLTWSYGYGYAIYNTLDSDDDERARIFKNNLSYDNETGTIGIGLNALYTHEYNSWDTPSGVTITDDDFISVDSTGITAARQADGSLPDNNCYNYFLRLASGSALIDAGTNVGLPFGGSAPDLGYFETSSTSAEPAAPVYISSVIQNSTPAKLEITHSLTLANIIPSVSAFAVKVNNVIRTISSITISGTKVLLTLANPVVYGDVVNVAYIKPASNPLQTSTGGQVPSINPQPVTNNCTSPVVNQPPVISLSSPVKSTSFIAPATVTIEAVASDPDGRIIKVEFYQGAAKLGERTSAPYSFSWKEVPAGTYSVTAVATDNLNLRTISSAVSVAVEKSATAVNQLPIVNITAPVKGKKSKKNDDVVIEVMASDPDGSISMVELKNGNVTIAKMETSPYLFTMVNPDTGKYQITAVATDNLGASNASSIFELIVEDIYDANSEIIKLYPNPNNGQFSVDLLSSLPGEHKSLHIISLTGQTIYNDILTDGHMKFDLANSTAGTYILMITSDNSIIATKKFIKNN